MTLTDSIREIVGKESSNTTKRLELLKLGLRPNEVSTILSIYKPGQFAFQNMTFGLEIECYNCPREALVENARIKGLEIYSEGYNHNDRHWFKIVSDASLDGENTNEVVTPVLKGKKGLDSLKNLCKALSMTGANVNKSCGLHVHIGLAGMTDAHYIRVFKNYQKLEMVIDSFMPYSRRGSNNRYCKSLLGYDFTDCRFAGDVRDMIGTRYTKVNSCSRDAHGTVEFRQHSGTTDYEKMVNWVRFLAALVAWSEKNEIQSVSRIEDIPFLTDELKTYYINRKNELNRCA